MVRNSDIEKYWLNNLSGELLKSTFPYDNIRIDTRRDYSNVFEFRFADDLFTSLMRLCNNSLPRLQMILTAGVISLLFKYSGNNDIIVGTSIYEQESDSEFINTILPLRIPINERMSFKELLFQVRRTISEADENQNYPIERLLQKIKIPYSKNDDFPLFDIVILLENIQSKAYIQHIYPNMFFSFQQTGNSVDGLVMYNSILYRRETVERIIVHLDQLLYAVFANLDLALAAINILTGEEKKQLVDEFNNTRTEYPKDVTIIELFEQQAAKTPDNIAVVYKDNQIAYKKLRQKSSKMSMMLREKGEMVGKIIGIIAEHSIELVTGILGILRTGAAYLPLDPKNPVERIKFILEDSNASLILIQEHLIDKHKAALERFTPDSIFSIGNTDFYPGKMIDRDIPRCPKNVAYIIYTSGTTGKPKGVIIDHQGLVNYICWAAKQHITDGHGDFPLFTSISFDLTVTSIFTPLITGYAIIVYSDEYKETLIEQVIAEQKVGVVKITPSHLKLVRHRRISNSSIKRLIVGGEYLDTQLARDITDNFDCTVDMINEYGPTEAVVGCMMYKFNSREDTGKTVPLGVPGDNVQIYLLDNGLKPVPVGVTGEIYISGDGIAWGYLNRVELTAERFIQDPFSPRQRMYKTGDLARWSRESTVEFIGRADYQLKIRGYRVEIGEIENCLSRYPLVKEAIVMARKDNLGENQLVAYVVPEPRISIDFLESPEHLEKELRIYLKGNVPDYMIPDLIEVLEEIPLTSNGKIDRGKLQELSHNSRAAYTPPRDKFEKRLVEIWSGNLGIPGDQIGIDADYFELGGHSLKATILLAQIHKEFDVRVPLAGMFKHSTIRGLGESIQGMIKERYESIRPAEEKEYYVLSSAQRRMYVQQQMDRGGLSYNVLRNVVLEGRLDLERLANVFVKLIGRHESLRTSIEVINEEPAQRIYDKVEFAMDFYDAQGSDVSEVERIIKKFVRAFDLSRAPMLRAGLIKQEENKHILMIDMHHIVTDGISSNLFINESMAFYQGKELPPLRLQYKDFAEWQNRMYVTENGKFRKQESYWLELFAGKIPFLDMPTDYERAARGISIEGIVKFKIDEVPSNKIKQITAATETTLYMVLSAVYYILLSIYTNAEDIVVGSPVSGRTHFDLQNVMGMLVNILPMRNYPCKDKAFREFLKEVKENALAAYENQDYQYDELIEKLRLRGCLGSNRFVTTVFTLQNSDSVETDLLPVDISDLKMKPFGYYYDRVAKFDLTLDAIEGDKTIFMWCRYSKALFKQCTIEKITQNYVEILKQVAENIDIKLDDIKIPHGLVIASSNIVKLDTEDFDF